MDARPTKFGRSKSSQTGSNDAVKMCSDFNSSPMGIECKSKDSSVRGKKTYDVRLKVKCTYLNV